MTELRQTFRPEFLNRIDEIIVFRQLTEENIRSIAANMQAIAEKLEKLQAQSVPAEAPKPEADGENQETHKVSLKK